MAAATKSKRFGHYVWIVERTCSNGHAMKLVAGDTRRAPSLPVGGTICHCGARITF